jgi:hypothetical protein
MNRLKEFLAKLAIACAAVASPHPDLATRPIQQRRTKQARPLEIRCTWPEQHPRNSPDRK